MTVSNFVEIIILVCSVIAVAGIVKCSNRKVEELDGLGGIVKKKDEKGIVVAHFWR